jgi:predicted HTH transcriptional regulator
VTTDRSSEYLSGLVNELRKLPKETEWVEFKMNDAEPQDIGEYLSALANSAALFGKAFAYLIWGIDDESHEVKGTTFSPSRIKVGNEELENWLLRLLVPKIQFRFFEFEMDGRTVALLELGRAFRHPVRIFDQTPFEDLIASEEASPEEGLSLLDYPSYFDLLKIPLPETRDGILKALASDLLIRRTDSGKMEYHQPWSNPLCKKTC